VVVVAVRKFYFYLLKQDRYSGYLAMQKYGRSCQC